MRKNAAFPKNRQYNTRVMSMQLDMIKKTTGRSFIFVFKFWLLTIFLLQIRPYLANFLSTLTKIKQKNRYV